MLHTHHDEQHQPFLQYMVIAIIAMTRAHFEFTFSPRMLFNCCVWKVFLFPLWWFLSFCNWSFSLLRIKRRLHSTKSYESLMSSVKVVVVYDREVSRAQATLKSIWKVHNAVCKWRVWRDGGKGGDGSIHCLICKAQGPLPGMR